MEHDSYCMSQACGCQARSFIVARHAQVTGQLAILCSAWVGSSGHCLKEARSRVAERHEWCYGTIPSRVFDLYE